MTDDERARDTLDKLIQEIHVYRDGEIYYNTEVMKAHLILFARDERRRVWEEAANQAAKGAHVWSSGIGNRREEQALLEFANYCRRQAEKETHG